MLKNCVASGTCSSSLQASGERSCLSNVGLLFKGNTTVGTLTLAQLTAWTSYLLIKTEFKTEMHEILHTVVICACLCWAFVSFLPLQKLPRFGWEKRSVVLILLLLFQLHHKDVGSAVQALNSVCLSVLFYHNTQPFQKVQDRRCWMFWANIVNDEYIDTQICGKFYLMGVQAMKDDSLVEKLLNETMPNICLML